MRSRASFATVATIAVLALIGPAAAQSPTPAPGPSLPPAPFAVAPPGSVFQFEKTKVVVGSADGYFVHYTSNGQPRTASLVAARDREYFTADALAELAKIWPLAVGKTVRYHRYEPRGGGRSWADEVRVVGTETVKIGEKFIDTYVVRWSSHGEYRNNWEGTWTNWYAPSLGWVVKIKGYDNYGIHEEDHVVGYELAK